LKARQRVACTLLAAVGALALVGTGCGVSDPSTNTVETFSQTLDVNGYQTHEFRAGRTGEFEITITELQPDSSAILVVEFGAIVSNQCTAQTSNFAAVGRLALNGPISSGRYCVGVRDVGGLRQTSTYTVRVSYPK
jgi:hypothetical protein